ncbi:hypothetical protein BDK62_11514 [Halomonas alkaliantarctica]|nr:hypothetical protein BDK62_11514 [Halomonas alkaliantarctica]
MSYDSWNDGGLTPLEHAAGLWGIIYGNGQCGCGDCDECALHEEKLQYKRKEELEGSARFKDAIKVVGGLPRNHDIKLALLRRIHLDSIDVAILRYMAHETLPAYYAGLLKSPQCIERLIEGLFIKVCRITPTPDLSNDIHNLASALRSNPLRQTAYERVGHMQRFIHDTIDRQFGNGASLELPVSPVKNALSAARLHLSIADANRSADYIEQLDAASMLAATVEYAQPQHFAAPPGKRARAMWRVRHLRPLSYYFSENHRQLLVTLRTLDEQLPREQFIYQAAMMYACR